MAERRMISKTFLMNNRFLKLSNDTKTLYVYLLNFADDDGIVARSIMIDNTLGVNDDNYKALEVNGLIIPYDDQIKVITDWNALQSIRKDIYSQTSYLEFRSQLFIKTNYSYTKNGDEKGVFSTADNWVRNGRPKDIRNFQPLIDSYLSDRNGIRNDDRNGIRNLSKDKVSIGKLSKDKISLDKDRLDKNNTKYINSSSNGGMGEDASSSSMQEISNKVNSEELAELLSHIGYIFQMNITGNNERLNNFLDTLIDEYSLDYIKQAIDKIGEQMTDLIGVSSPQQIVSMIINHLKEYITTVTQADSKW